MGQQRITPPLQPTVAATAIEWLTQKQVQEFYPFLKKTRFWELVSSGAFPVTRPKLPSGRKTRLVLVKRSDIDQFLAAGYGAV